MPVCDMQTGAQAKAVTPAQSTDTPFAVPAEAPKQQAQVAGEAAENAEQDGDMESEAASTLAPSLSTFKSEMGDSESGATCPSTLMSTRLRHSKTSGLWYTC